MGTESHMTISTSASDSSTAASSPTQLNSPTCLSFSSITNVSPQNYNRMNSNDLQACTSTMSRLFSPTNSILTSDASPQGLIIITYVYKI